MYKLYLLNNVIEEGPELIEKIQIESCSFYRNNCTSSSSLKKVIYILLELCHFTPS